MNLQSTTIEKLPGAADATYSLNLSASETVELEIVERQGLAGIVSVIAADGNEMVEADLSQRAASAKKLLVPVGGARIRVRAVNHSPLERVFELRTGQPHAVDERDGLRMQAEKLLGEGERLFRGERHDDREATAAAYEKALALWTRLANAPRQADTLDHLGDLRYHLGDTKSALETYQRALDLWTQQHDQAGMAYPLFQLAAVSFDTGQQPKAADYAARALEIDRAVGDLRGQAAALLVGGEVKSVRGENDQARQDYDEALTLAQKGGDRLLEVDVLSFLSTLEGSTARWAEEVEYAQRALTMAREEGDMSRVAQNLNNLATTSADTGELRKAAGYYEEDLPLKKQVSSPTSYATSLYNLANMQSKLGEYAKAGEEFSEALAIFQRTSFPRGEGYVLAGLGHLSLNTGDDDKAEAYFRQAEAAWHSASDRQGEIFALNPLGEIAAGRRQFSKAIELHRQALAASRAGGFPREEERTLGYLSDAYSAAGDQRASLEQASLELALALKIGDAPGQATALHQQGRAWRSLGEHGQARQALEQALALRESEGASGPEAETLFELAVLDRDSNLSAAKDRILKALDKLELIGASAGDAASRMSFAAAHRKSFDLAIDIAMRLHDDALGFELSERARARTLVDLIRGARLDIREGVQQTLLDQERHIQELLDARHEALTRLLASPHSATAEAKAKKEIDDAVEQYRQVEGSIRMKSPRYAALIEPQPLTLGDVQSGLLDPSAALIEFWLGEERSYAWLVTKTKCQGFELPPQRDIEMLARQAYGALNARNLTIQESLDQKQNRIDAADREFNRVAPELARTLLMPMKSVAGVRRLWIVSDGALEYLPFTALPAPGKTTPLIASYEIVRLPSASVLAEVRQEIAGRKTAARNAAIFADPVFQLDDERVHGSQTAEKPDVPRAANDVDLSHLPRLYFSRQEADAIAGLAPNAREELDFNASRAQAKQPALENYRVVHFATHALLDSQHPELSGLVLSMVDRSGRAQDGFLRLHEIYNLKLNADLVVLSGCQTALGEEVRSEGLVGLTRGFMYAGAPQVLASLWGVRDRATAEFMRRFYQAFLGNHLPPDAALRNAQLSMMKDPRWAQPYYWAAFTMQGAR